MWAKTGNFGPFFCLHFLALSTFFNMESYNGQIVLFTGTEFTATDKLGKSYRSHGRG